MVPFKGLNTSMMKSPWLWIAAGVGALVIGSRIYKEVTKYKLEGRVVLITGGSRGLGFILARQLAAKGARLAICARSEDQLDRARQFLEENDADVLALNVDIRSRRQVRTMVSDVINHYGRIDVLINNAGIIQVGPQDSMKLKDYEDAMLTNFWAPLYAMHAVLPHFNDQGEGRIVNITSIGGKIAVPHLLPYAASKFALVGLSEGMHAELKRQNIHVTTVVPNLMRTGSPRNITVKGNHELEYAWFKLSDSAPLFSVNAEAAARSIIKSLELGDAERILTISAKLATLFKGIAPSWVSRILSAVNTILPSNVAGGRTGKKGYESESGLTQGLLGSISDRAAEKYNEL